MCTFCDREEEEEEFLLVETLNSGDLFSFNPDGPRAMRLVDPKQFVWTEGERQGHVESVDTHPSYQMMVYRRLGFSLNSLY